MTRWTAGHGRWLRRAVLPVALVALAGLVLTSARVSASPEPQQQAARQTLPKIGHVFVITLENENYAGTFGTPAADPYLARTLPRQGALLTQYYGIGHESNDNYLAMISGQAPSPETQGDCQVYSDFAGTGVTASHGQVVGDGCVYPSSVKTVANQLSATGRSWKGYLQDMGNDPSRESAVCAHPALNAQDRTQQAEQGDGYATRHNPFVYFHSIVDRPSYCRTHDVPLGSPAGVLPPAAPAGTTGLATDLKRASTIPNLSYIVPNLCKDGHDYPCINQPSGASKLADTDGFLSTWIPKITASPAYQQDGLIVVTFDESDGPQKDSTACCNEQAGPNSPLPGISGPGGGRVGAVLLSPHIQGGTVTSVGYNHYSLLASIESFFGLKRLGYAQTVPDTFGTDIFEH